MSGTSGCAEGSLLPCRLRAVGTLALMDAGSSAPALGTEGEEERRLIKGETEQLTHIRLNTVQLLR